MRLIALAAGTILIASPLACSSGKHVVSNHGVRVTVPRGWQRVDAAGGGAIVDPQTLLVVGTKGVRPGSSQCLIASYRIPKPGAVVVVVGWKGPPSGAAGLRPTRAELDRLKSVRRATLECFSGRAAAAEVTLDRKVFQVNVLVGDRASPDRVAEALRVARSFDLAR